MNWAWLLILGIVVGGLIAFLLNKRTTPVYEAVTVLLVNEAPTTKTTDYSSLLASERLAKTYIELMLTMPVLEDVNQTLDLDMTPEELRLSIQADLMRNTQLIAVRVEDTNPKRAAEIANTLVDVFSEHNREIQATRYANSKANLQAELEQIETQIASASAELEALPDEPEMVSERERLEGSLGEYRQMYASLLTSFEQVRVAESSSISTVVPVEIATIPEVPIKPRILLNTMLAAILGLFVAGGVVLFVEALDDTLKPEDVLSELGLPILGVIAHHQSDNGMPITAEMPRSPVSEAFRTLRTNIHFASVDEPVRSLLITSPSPEDGKSTVAANLGVAMAQSGRQVILVDSDLRRPEIHKKLKLVNHTGVSTLLVLPRLLLDGTIQTTEIPNLSVITSGDLPPNPAELLASGKMNELIQTVTEHYDMVLIDTPPVMAVTDAAALATRVDGVLLVIKPGVTKLAACKQALEQLQRVGGKVLGVVLNDIEITRSRYRYGYYKGYYHTYHEYYDDGHVTIPEKK
jgi:non-specific protein-tyrosine kinase